MNEYNNEAIDTLTLPKFEEVRLTPLHPDYKKVVLINLALFFIVLGIVFGVAFYFIEDITAYWYIGAIVYAVILLLTFTVNLVRIKNSGFAFRTHDVIFKSGAIAITTTIIPYNRVQHAALHEGILSRRYGLAAVEIFTAGGESSDIKIPGIEKEHAERIKQLLMGKVLNVVHDEE